MTTGALVIIPAFNEEESLPQVLGELAREVPEYDVVVVSDGSVDRTAAVARSAGVAVLELPYNLGIGGALRAGFRFAVQEGYEYGFQFDADGQHDPHELAKLREVLDGGADMVIGSRFSDGGAPTYAVGRLRRQAMRFLEWLVRRLVGRRYTDTSSGFRAFSRPMLEYFARTYPVEYMDSVEALVLACNGGFRVEETGVNMRGRTGGAPSTRSWRLVYYYVRLVVVITVSYTRARPIDSDGEPTALAPGSEGAARRPGLAERGT